MGVSYYVEGLRPKTEEYSKKLNIYKACKEINIEPPKEIIDFFDGEICEEGIITDLPKDAVRVYSDGYCAAFYEVDITKIPKDIEKVRFVVS